MLALFHRFRQAGHIGNCPIYIGGLGTKLTEIYDRLANKTPRQNPSLQLLDTLAPYTMAGQAAAATPVHGQRLYAISSGMMTEKTLSNSFARQIISDPKHALFFVGYADPLSPAGRLRSATAGSTVQLSPEFPPQPLRCNLQTFQFSAHATRESIRAYVNRVRPKKIVLVHGDPAAIEWFRSTLAIDLPQSQVITPTPGQPITL